MAASTRWFKQYHLPDLLALDNTGRKEVGNKRYLTAALRLPVLNNNALEEASRLLVGGLAILTLSLLHCAGCWVDEREKINRGGQGLDRQRKMRPFGYS